MMRISLFLIYILFGTFEIFYASTIIGVKCTDGILLAADSLSSSADSPMIDNRTTKKLFLLRENVAVCCVDPGTAKNNGGFFRFYSKLREIVTDHEDTHEEALKVRSVAYCARKLLDTLHSDIHVVIAGYDEVKELQSAPLSVTSKKGTKEIVDLESITIREETSTSSAADTESGTEHGCTNESDVTTYSTVMGAPLFLGPSRASSATRSGSHERVSYFLCELLPGGSSVEQQVVVAGTGSPLIETLLHDALLPQPYARSSFRYAPEVGPAVKSGRIALFRLIDQKSHDHRTMSSISERTRLNQMGGDSNGSSDAYESDNDIGRSDGGLAVAEPQTTPATRKGFPGWNSAAAVVGKPSQQQPDQQQMQHQVELTVAQAERTVAHALHMASRLDPRTGGERITMWALHHRPIAH